MQTYFYNNPLATGIKNFFGETTDTQQMAFNAEQAQLQREFNSAEAQKNRDFQERMSNTQWQRAVADMEAAGLNSALAYSQGGAGTPSGSTASGSAASSAVNAGGFFKDALSIIGGVAKAAITANSAKALSELTTVTDMFKTRDGATRTMSWKE